MKTASIPQDYALVLAQVSDAGQEEFNALVESLRFDRRRLSHIVKALQHKGLILVKRSGYSDVWIGLTRRGQRLITAMWPEARMSPQLV